MYFTRPVRVYCRFLRPSSLLLYNSFDTSTLANSLLSSIRIQVFHRYVIFSSFFVPSGFAPFSNMPLWSPSFRSFVSSQRLHIDCFSLLLKLNWMKKGPREDNSTIEKAVLPSVVRQNMNSTIFWLCDGVDRSATLSIRSRKFRKNSRLPLMTNINIYEIFLNR